VIGSRRGGGAARRRLEKLAAILEDAEENILAFY
jgi:hypothetical protein